MQCHGDGPQGAGNQSFDIGSSRNRQRPTLRPATGSHLASPNLSIAMWAWAHAGGSSSCTAQATVCRRLIAACCAAAIAALPAAAQTAPYIQQAQGSCPASSSSFIETKAMCSAAAAKLGLPTTSVEEENDPEAPHGCYFNRSTLKLNLAGDRGSEGKDRVSLCKGMHVRLRACSNLKCVSCC